MTACYPLLLSIGWTDPEWLLAHFGHGFVWASLAMVFIECGLLFPFLPGDTLLFAIGVFLAANRLELTLHTALLAFAAVAILGNLAGYEIGRAIGPTLYQRQGRLINAERLDHTRDFFDKHGSKALILARFVPVVRTFITLIAGATQMNRRRFLTWSTAGALAWVSTITLLGYLLGHAVPWLGANVDYATLAILGLTLIPITLKYWRHKNRRRPTASQHPEAQTPR